MSIKILEEYKFTYQYPGHNFLSNCHMRVWESLGSYYAVASENEDNPGMSVTNAAEYLWPKLMKQMNWYKKDLDKTIFLYEWYGSHTDSHSFFTSFSRVYMNEKNTRWSNAESSLLYKLDNGLDVVG